MIIVSIILNNFRNIKQLKLEPSNKFNFIVGKNAQGKTSIIESIYLATYLKSFRTSKNEDLINFEKKCANINITATNFQVNNTIDLYLTKDGKSVTINNKKPLSYSDFFNHLRPILFSPEEIILVKGSPSARRSLLDRAIFQSSVNFIDTTIQYNKFLRQRNRLLKEGKDCFEIEPWTEGLIKSGTKVRISRINFIKRISSIFTKTYQKITLGSEFASLSYPGMNNSELELEEVFRQELLKCTDREIAFGQTMAGPHRDDPVFLINGRSLRQFASQGQQRSFVLAFKTAQIIDLENITGETPVLLLDDITSELDRNRQQYFFEFLLERTGQVFITSTDIDPLVANGLTNGDFFEVDRGQIRKLSP